MLVLGITGNLYGDLWHELPPRVPYRSDFEGNHDAAAVLLRDGHLVAAVEQERVDRIKHSGGFPVDAIERCLSLQGCTLDDVDFIACSYSYASLRSSLLRCHVHQRSQRGDRIETDPVQFMRSVLQRGLRHPIDASRLRFVKHHLSHAASAFWPSGFDRALVATLDGSGEDESGSLCLGDGCDIRMLRPLRPTQSLGLFYMHAIRLLGFRLFDEYKVMGLAPYGNPDVYRNVFSEFFELKSDGEYVLHLDRIPELAESIVAPAPSAPFTQQHMDFAAALQSALETIAFHLLEHFQQETRLRHLALAGGVAHNCTLNGNLQSSGLFDRVFVQPAAHDGGLALGAALMVYREETGGRPPPVSHVYLGSNVGTDEEIESVCRCWSDFVEFRRSADVIAETATLLAEGKIIGWVQDRAEYGPRALGNRSILADPRPKENKRIINAMVKKREGFRPFAPAVLAERAPDYFVVPEAQDFEYMTFVVSVRPEKRALLGAVCHVDGSARLQAVTSSSNPKFWALIQRFGEISGVPVLLNTSFNNNAEPIVDSATDAIVCFLTTGLDALVIGDVVVRRKCTTESQFLTLVPRLRPHVSLHETYHRGRDGNATRRREIRPLRSSAGSIAVGVPISEPAFRLLQEANGAGTLAQAADSKLDPAGLDQLAAEMRDLWSRRLIDLSPLPLRHRAACVSEMSAPTPLGA